MLEETLVLLLNALIFPGGLFALVIGLSLMGIDRKIAARLQRRVGPPLYQPFIDLVKLYYKEMMVPNTAHKTAFQLAPILGFMGMFAATVLLPIAGVYSGLNQVSDLLVILYLLAIPAIALMLAGSASSSPFGAVGLSREMVMVMAYETPLVLTMLTIALKVGAIQGTGVNFSLSEIVNYQLANGSFIGDVTLWPAFLGLLCFIPATMGVVPFDIPEAETEIVEGPIVEYSGLGLAFFKVTGALKLYVVLALVVALFFPVILPFGTVINLLWFLVKICLLMIVTITVVRTSTGRLRIDQAFKFFLFIPSALALISLIITLIIS